MPALWELSYIRLPNSVFICRYVVMFLSSFLQVTERAKGGWKQGEG